MRAPRKASAASRSSMPCAQATTVSEWSLAWRMDNNTVPAKVLAPRSEGCRYQRLDENSASGLLLCDSTLNQPLTPQASAMRPTSTASVGSSAGSRVRLVAMAGDSRIGKGRGSPRMPTKTAPFRGVVEADALDEAAITAHALVSNDDVEERTALGAAAGESNDDHDLSFGW